MATKIGSHFLVIVIDWFEMILVGRAVGSTPLNQRLDSAQPETRLRNNCRTSLTEELFCWLNRAFRMAERR